MKKKLIIIGIDGGTYEIVNSLGVHDSSILQEFMSEGVHGTLTSTIPPHTNPSWTSIFTGVNPGKHGVTGFMIKDKYGSFVLANKSMVAYIWKLVEYAGLRSIIVNNPITYPPEKINGIMITGFLTPPESKDFVFPSHLRGELDKVCNGYMPELPSGYEKLIAKNKIKAYELINKFSEKVSKATLYLIRNYEWDIFIAVFTSTDRLQHFFWNEKRCIHEHYKRIERTIIKILDYEPEANIFVVSDHGFGSLGKYIYVNSWLHKLGFLQLSNSAIRSALSVIGLTRKNIGKILTNLKLYNLISKITPLRVKMRIPFETHEKDLIDYHRSRAFLFGYEGVYIKDEQLKEQILYALTKIKDNGQSVFTEIMPRENVLWGPYVYRAPDIFVVPTEGYETSPSLNNGILGPPIENGAIMTGTHRRKGIFIAYGPDMKKRYKLNINVNTWDITPTLLHLLGLPVPDYMDGRVLKEIFKEGALPNIRPVKLQKYHKLIPRKVSEKVYTSKEEEEIKKRLQSLGYL